MSKATLSTRKLEELCDIQNGKAFRPGDWEEQGLPIVRIQNLNREADHNYYSGVVDPKYLIEPGTILFSWSGSRATSFGAHWWSGPRAILNQHIYKITPHPGIHRRWLFHALDIARQEAEKAAHGTGGLVHVRKSDFVKYEIPTPPLPQQRRIANILDTIDRAIRKTEEVIAKLEQMKRGLLHDLLTRGIDENGELRDPVVHPEKFKETELGLIPREWEVLELRDSLKAIEAGRSFSCPNEPAGSGEWGILKVSAIKPNGLVFSENKVVTDLSKVVPDYEIRPGDVLLSRANTSDLVGLICYVDDCRPRLLLSDKTLRLRPVQEHLVPRFLVLALQAPSARRQIQTVATGSSGSMKNISQKKLGRVSIALPKLLEQHRILRAVKRCEARLLKEAQTVEKLRLNKAGLASDLLSSGSVFEAAPA